jgi:hypothetical protein
MATAAVKPTQYQESSIGFAEDIAPFARKLLGTAELYTDLEENPYQQYMRDRQAQFTPLQQQSFENAGLMQTAPQLGDATAMAGMAGLGALNTQYTFNPYQTQQFTGTNTLPGYDAQGKFQPGTGSVGQYMSPYMDTVVARQQSDAQRQGEIARQMQNAQAARSGAFGGSGNLLANNQLNASLMRQKGDIQAKGLQDAYQQAMAQFNQSQAQNLAGQQLNAQQQQFGAGLGLQGLQTAMTGAKSLADIGQTQYGQNLGLLDVQNRFGAQQQQQMQNALNTEYQDFLNYQNYPYKQMGFMSDMIRGLPMAQLSSTMYQQPPSMVSQVAGLGGAALTGAKLFGAAGGATGDLERRPAGLAELAIHNMG